MRYPVIRAHVGHDLTLVAAPNETGMALRCRTCKENLIVIRNPEAVATARCSACGFEFPYKGDDLTGIEDWNNRFVPGEVIPAAQCPQCGELAYKI